MSAIWKQKKYDLDKVKNLHKELDVSETLAHLLYNRGIRDAKQGREFLFANLNDLSEPLNMYGMQSACQRIESAIEKQEKIVVYGDYDVDGVCSTVILTECLQLLDARVDNYIPDRFNEGYGLNDEAIKELATSGCNLLISVDCGITSVQEVALANSLGMEVIITDHHTPDINLPDAVSIINPRLDNNKVTSGLAGAGVAFQLARSLGSDRIEPERIWQWLDLVCLATIADIVPLTGDNRILVRYGLEKIQTTFRPGLKALMRKTGRGNEPVTTWQVGFILAPRLNAAGRMASARISLELLTCFDEKRADDLAEQLCLLNSQRKDVENSILMEAINRIENDYTLQTAPVLVVDGENWHHGVLGIVASRLCERYLRPVIMISWEGDTGRGSARSVADFNIIESLSQCKEYLLASGGHKMAAGLSINRENIELFRQKINQLAVSQGKLLTLDQEMEFEVELNGEFINTSLIKELDLLKPYGEGNPQPVFYWKKCTVDKPCTVGDTRQHVRATVNPGNINMISFNRPEFIHLPTQEMYQDILFHVEENHFRNQTTIQLKILDMRPSINNDILNADSYWPAFNKYTRAIQDGQGVVIVFPTYRILCYGREFISQYFRPHVIQPIHGRLSVRQRQMALQAFQSHNQIFLITRAFANYYNKKYPWPGHIAYGIHTFPFDNWRTTQCISSMVWDTWGQDRPKLKWLPLETTDGINKYDDMCELAAAELASDNRNVDISGKEQFVLNEVPGSILEAHLLMQSINLQGEIPVKVNFSREDLKVIHNKLEQIYPDQGVLSLVLSYLKKEGKVRITLNLNEVCIAIQSETTVSITAEKVLSALNILVDLGLCQIDKQGSIIEIKLLPNRQTTLDLADSPYYLEGIAEKKAFADLETSLNDMLMW